MPLLLINKPATGLAPGLLCTSAAHDSPAVLATINHNVDGCGASDTGQWLGMIARPSDDQGAAGWADSLPRQHHASRDPRLGGWGESTPMSLPGNG